MTPPAGLSPRPLGTPLGTSRFCVGSLTTCRPFFTLLHLFRLFLDLTLTILLHSSTGAPPPLAMLLRHAFSPPPFYRAPRHRLQNSISSVRHAASGRTPAAAAACSTPSASLPSHLCIGHSHSFPSPSSHSCLPIFLPSTTRDCPFLSTALYQLIKGQSEELGTVSVHLRITELQTASEVTTD